MERETTGVAHDFELARLGPVLNHGICAVTSEFGAGNEIRTRDLNLGKVALYQLSYSRILMSGVP